MTIPFGDDHDSGEKVSAVDFTGTTTGGDWLHDQGRQRRSATRSTSALDLRYSEAGSTTRSPTTIRPAAASRSRCPTPAIRSGAPGGPRRRRNRTTATATSPASAGQRLRLQARRHRRLVRRRRPRKVHHQAAGISVWTLLNWWERTKVFGTSAGDGRRREDEHPGERHPASPICSTSTRWELEFELKMRVPEGQPLAGMVHAKIHDGNWTQLGLGPQEDPMVRYLQPATDGGHAEPGRQLRAGRRPASGRRSIRRSRRRASAAAERAWAKSGSLTRRSTSPKAASAAVIPTTTTTSTTRVLLAAVGRASTRSTGKEASQGVAHQVAPPSSHDQSAGDRRGGCTRR